jgi:antitoxin PrlF
VTKLAYSKLSVKSQTVLPRDVREKLGLKPGDTVQFRIENDVVVLEKVQPALQDDPFASFSEWATSEDDDAYADL